MVQLNAGNFHLKLLRIKILVSVLIINAAERALRIVSRLLNWIE